MRGPDSLLQFAGILARSHLFFSLASSRCQWRVPAAEAPARRQARRIGQHAPGAPRKCLWRGGPGVAGARRCRVAVLRRVRAPKSFNGSARPLLRRLIAVRPAAAARAGWGLLEQTFGEVAPGLPGPAAAVARRCRRRRRRPPAWWQCLRTTLLGVLMPARAPTTFRRHAHVADVLRGCTLRRVRGFPGLLQARKRSKSGWEGGEVPSSCKSGQDCGLCSSCVTSEAIERPENTPLCSRARSRLRWGVKMYQNAA